ncbi:hypothetical protein GTK54_05805 [Streptococcus pyogenes]|nr:hypothetical protein [Streptococcus pyogenes]
MGEIKFNRVEFDPFRNQSRSNTAFYYVPYRDGALRGSSRANSVGVTWSGPHARAQFYGGAYNKYKSFKFKKYTTPGTGKRWDKRALATNDPHVNERRQD